MLGRQIGRYRILEELGSGGMSQVYKGLDTALDRMVAVKVLHPHLAGKEDARKRLAREAKAVAKLHHPNILEVFDFSAEGSADAYIVTEYIRGRTLRQFQSEHAFHPPELAALVAHSLATALAHAHESGVIHRDLKPENAMVREDGVLKLMDFGIAKILDREDRMTVTGALVGSPAHMAPEIIEGEESGAPADIFSLGTMLYLFTTGKLPFVASNTTATLKRILDGVYEDPLRLVPSLSDELGAILARTLARDPKARYPHAGELRDALAAYLKSVGLERPIEELAQYFADPVGYPKRLVPRLVASLLDRAERELAEKRAARALGLLNQVLALEEGNARALRLIDQMNRARRRNKRVKRARNTVAGLLGASALVFAVQALWPAPPPPPKLAAQPVVPRATPKSAPPPLANPGPSSTSTPTTVAAVVPPVSSTPPRPRALPAASPARASAVIKLRPFGYVQVDQGPRSPSPENLHKLDGLAVGKHTVTVSCDFCLEQRKTIEVTAGGPNEFRFQLELKPSTLAFRYDPPDAVVRLAGIERAAAQTQQAPFEVISRDAAGLKHAVSYEILREGYRPLRKTELIEAGKHVVLEGALARE